jgi:hypothetical protein
LRMKSPRRGMSLVIMLNLIKSFSMSCNAAEGTCPLGVVTFSQTCEFSSWRSYCHYPIGHNTGLKIKKKEKEKWQPSNFKISRHGKLLDKLLG